MEMACMVGFTPSAFWELTPRELQNAVNGFTKKQKIAWEQIRWGAYYTLLPHWDNKKGRLTTDKIWLPIDKPIEIEISEGKCGIRKLSRDELRQLYKKSGMAISQEHLDSIYGRE
ncbi:MAG: hypothetical protein AAF391_08080 [Bacteroidota bacterium]